MKVIAERFHLPWPEPPEVKLADSAVVYLEALYLKDEYMRDWDQSRNEEIMKFLGENDKACAHIVSHLRDPWVDPREIFELFMATWHEMQLP